MDIVQFIGRFHVLLLHLPIGILLMAACMEGYFAISGKPRVKFMATVWLWGALSAIGACILGYMLSLDGGYDADAVFIHRTWGITLALAASGCWMYFRRAEFDRKTYPLVLSAAQLLLLFGTGHYGANLTHGPTFLVEYAPNPIRAIAGLPPHQAPRPEISSLAEADVYLDVVRPIFKQRCITCHNTSKTKGGLNMDTLASLMAGGKSGAAITAGKLGESEIYRRITLSDHDKEYMPADGKTPLTDEQVAALKWWITSDAPAAGSLEGISRTEEENALLSIVLGLEAPAGSLQLPEIESIDQQVIMGLESQGFVVKNIAENQGYLDIDYSVSRKAISDEALNTLLKARDHITWLNLSGCSLTDEQLNVVAQFTKLTRLRIEKNPVSNMGVQALTELPKLAYLNLYGTEVDNGSLESLVKMKALKRVYLWQTKVSEKAVSAQVVSNPNLVFDLGEKIEMKKKEQEKADESEV